MSIKSKVLAAAATLTLMGGLAAGLSAAPVSWAATPSCGPTCIDLYSKQFGTHHHPAFVMDVFRGAAKVGQPVILFRQSNADGAQDFTIAFEGQVSDFFQAGMVSSALNLRYGCNRNVNTGLCSSLVYPDLYAFEVEYSPYGALSGLCVGVSQLAALSGQGVSLQPCGFNAGTVWVADTTDSCLANPLYHNEIPVINGLDTNFSHPFVLTYPSAGFPTDVPRPQLRVNNLTGFSQSGNSIPCNGIFTSVQGVNSNQLWSAVAGVLH